MKYRMELPAPGDIKNTDLDAKYNLCKMAREIILETVSKNGGHLSSNLGVVELTVALHSVFDFPRDKIIFDVGHQCYAHKIISGRDAKFSTIRLANGISGFQKRNESEYDCFGGGHSGTSLSAALGFATAAKMKNEDIYVVAVIGDGSFTNGMIHEAINNAVDKDLKLIIILNDNEMSISKNVGMLSKCFGNLRSSAGYHRFKRKFKRGTKKMRWFGRPIAAIGRGIKNFVKRMVWSSNFFENLGIDYMGPVDGHDIKKLEGILTEAKENNGVTIVHVCTQKGRGYEPAEEHPDRYHSVGPFDLNTGISDEAADSALYQTFETQFGHWLSWAANTDTSIVAITAAMCEGTGLSEFKKTIHGRFFDVGIAEEHAVTFAAGLAAAGMRPYVAIYSSFLQRSYDQLIHDVAIQNLPVIFSISHAGLVPGDGVTHQGIFDCGFLLSIPNITVYSVENFTDLRAAFDETLQAKGPVAIRYPKGVESDYSRKDWIVEDGYRVCRLGSENPVRICLITHGRLTRQLYEAAKILSDTYAVRVISITRVKPLNLYGILQYCVGMSYIYFVEEQIKTGGLGEVLFSEMVQYGYTPPAYEINAITDFPMQGSLEELDDYYGFTVEKIVDHIRNTVDPTEHPEEG